MKSTWFSKKIHYDFAKLVHEAGHYSQRPQECIYDFIELTFLSLNQSLRVMYNYEIREDWEKQYARILKKYKSPENFPQAFALLVDALEDETYDFLGSVFMELEMNNSSGLGQVFTPYPICKLMSMMALQGIESEKYTMLNRCLINEPSCGGGAMIIAALEVLKENNIGPDQFFVYAADLDIKCVMMCYIQLFLLDIPAIIEHKNTLSLECWGRYPTFAALRYPLYSINGICNFDIPMKKKENKPEEESLCLTTSIQQLIFKD